MTISDQFSLAVQAYQSIREETKSGNPSFSSDPGLMDIEEYVNSQRPTPTGMLPLGLATDGLPLLLDLNDPTPGPLLVSGDKGSGKTAFLNVLAYCSDHLYDAGDIQFGVITDFPEEWNIQETLPNCLGIWPANHRSVRDFISQTLAWAEIIPGSRQVILFLLDDLDLIKRYDRETQQDLRCLLTYGPEKQIWPIVTINAGRIVDLADWTGFFQTRIFGHVGDPHLSQVLVGGQKEDLTTIVPSTNFSLQCRDKWLRFWIPSLRSDI